MTPTPPDLPRPADEFAHSAACRSEANNYSLTGCAPDCPEAAPRPAEPSEQGLWWADRVLTLFTAINPGKPCPHGSCRRCNVARELTDFEKHTRQDEREKAAEDGAREALEAVAKWPGALRLYADLHSVPRERFIALQEAADLIQKAVDSLQALRGGKP